jgi:hypothetical protein
MKKHVTLLFVKDGSDRQVVSVETFNVQPGDLVEYVAPDRVETEDPEVGLKWDIPEKTRLGLVVKKMECERFGNEWSCVAEISRILEGKAIYCQSWSSEEPETK